MKTLKKVTVFSILTVMSSFLFVTAAQANNEYVIAEPYLIEDPYLVETDYDYFFEEDPYYIAPFEFEPYFDTDPADPYIDDWDIYIELEGALTQDGRAALNWTPYLEPDFLMYKIVHDQQDTMPYYPKHGYLDYFEDPYKTGYITGEVPEGDNYFTVCVITTDDRRGCSNSIFLYVDPVFTFEPDFEPEYEPDFEEIPLPEIDEEFEPEESFEEEVLPPREELPVNEDRADKVTRPGFFQRSWKFIENNVGTIVAIITVIIAISGFTFAAKRKQKSISKYINQIDDTYSEYKMKAKRCEAELYRLKDIVDDQLKTGKIDEGAYSLLMGRIEGYMIDIQKQIVNEKFGGLPASMKDQMFKMMEDGEITEAELEAMQTLIKRSELSASEKDSLLETVKDFKKQDEVMKKKGRRD